MTKLIWLIVLCSSICTATPIRDKRHEAALYITGTTDSVLISRIQQRAYDLYNLKVIFKGRMEMPPPKHDSVWMADRFTDNLKKIKTTKKYLYTIAVTDVMLVRAYCMFDVDNFSLYNKPVAGYSNIPYKNCIVTRNDLKEYDSDPDSLNLNRTVNVVMHELGHLIGLGHCDNTECLMIGEGHMDAHILCGRCAYQLKQIK